MIFTLLISLKSLNLELASLLNPLKVGCGIDGYVMWACETLTSLLKVVISLVLKMSYLIRIDFAVLVKQVNRLEEGIP